MKRKTNRCQLQDVLLRYNSRGKYNCRYYITKASLVNTILKIETISNILYNKLKPIKFKRSDYKFKPKINTVQFNLITYYSTEF